jgi:hypothetical protein
MKYVVLTVALLGAAVADTSGQVQFRVGFAIAWGTQNDSVYVGVNGGNGSTIEPGTYGLDDVSSQRFGPVGLYGETPPPPPPPTGYQTFFFDTKGRTEIISSGGLFRFDFRAYVSETQVDTFMLEVDQPSSARSPVTLRWDPVELAKYGTAWLLAESDFDGNLTPVAPQPDMLQVGEHTFPYAGSARLLGIVKTGAKAVTGVEEVEGVVPEVFELQQNYPNPFNPSTEIVFSVPMSGRVNLTVYNMLGQLVSTLLDEVKPAGVYRAQFDARGLSSGAYVYRLTAGTMVAAKRMLLVR